MEPLRGFGSVCEEAFTIGEVYRLELASQRSQATHNHYFAAIADAWDNLPEGLAEQLPTAEHLRKYALIKAGYHDERSIVTSSKAQAQRLAAFVKPMDEYAVVVVSRCVVTVYTAKSQSMRAMGARAFNASKQKVLDVIAGLIGTSSDELQQAAGKAA